MNKKEIINEFLVVMITDTMFIFTDFCDNLELRYTVGWAYIAIMFLCICYNGYFILRSIHYSFSLLYLKYKPRKEKLKVKVEQEMSEEPNQIEILNIF